VSAVLRQPIPIMPWISTSRTLIGIGCLKSADTNNYFLYRLATADTKKTSFFILYKWYRPGGPIPKIPYQPILQTYSVVVICVSDMQLFSFTYLGLPMGTTNLKVEDFVPLVQRIKRRLTSTSNFLSQASILEMVNSVLYINTAHFLYEEDQATIDNN
jgi:hypothetical protein